MGSTARSRRGGIAVWMSIVALGMGAALVVPYLALRNALLIPVFLLLFVAGSVGLILGLQLRSAGMTSAARSRTAVASAAGSLVLAVVLGVAFAGATAADAIGRSGLHEVQLDGHGPVNMQATVSSELGTNTYTWPADSWAKLRTKGTWAELRLEAPAGSVDQTVSCEIRWNGEQVVAEQSDSGSVTCRYDAP